MSMPRRRVISVCSTTSTPMVMMATAMTERWAIGRTNSRSTTSATATATTMPTSTASTNG
jgi:hypothetical protein